MRKVWQSIKTLWKAHLGFKLAVLYLLLLLTLALLLPLLPLNFGPNYLDLEHAFLSPFSSEALASGHVFGTDNLGRDLLANMLYGARTAFFIALPVMSLATLLGLLLGTGAGFYGANGLVLPRHRLLFFALALLLVLYYGLYLPLYVFKLGMGLAAAGLSVAFLLVAIALSWAATALLLKRFPFWRKANAVPVDQFVLRLTEALSSIPRFVLILVLASFVPPSVALLSLLLVLTLWPSAARLARAEMLRIKGLPYFEAAQSIGSSPRRLLWRHALPNLLGPVLVAFTFGLGGLLALESTLSFLNIGVPTTLVSWGRTISNIRGNTSAWWLVALPGGLLSLTVLALYTCSHYLTKEFRTKSKG
ncbi:ABC transporter permease [Pontibacter actiniarum]|uniref:ABC transporter permease n=1 Tax=Pontibacter actiniarum TaxID=323450 RepID=A0A1X9YPG7_9BACT|nr:ABC transporter permease [Pontibacter actiniarum]ARS34721.1 ABC transporter permease [Pontibacter actiniarum]